MFIVEHWLSRHQYSYVGNWLSANDCYIRLIERKTVLLESSMVCNLVLLIMLALCFQVPIFSLSELGISLFCF